MVWGFATTPTKDLPGREDLERRQEEAPICRTICALAQRPGNCIVTVRFGVWPKNWNLSADGLYTSAPSISDDTAWQKVKDEVYKGFLGLWRRAARESGRRHYRSADHRN